LPKKVTDKELGSFYRQCQSVKLITVVSRETRAQILVDNWNKKQKGRKNRALLVPTEMQICI